ncbi:MAG: quinone-dependent dihydroorotate dehydrogenase [Gammaproteobacteria bacterium]|nr:quinone-dependent dihydroorotate dehydrogenase [Gammaproteobacteria bacterium]
MYACIRSLLFRLDPERAHAWALGGLHYVPAMCFSKPTPQPQTVMGLDFPHQIGLAAGLDKSGQYLDDLDKLGFGFIEIGTVTPKPQIGNSKPRLFRLPQAQALINRMGFNNPGVDALVANVAAARYQGVLGINIGKGKETPLDRAVDDYLYCLHRVYPHASYIAINISSPNTPDLRQLQREGYCLNLLHTLRQEQLRLADHHGRHVPLVVKISPDEPDESLLAMADIIVTQGIEGIIATNTTCARDGVKQLEHGQEVGGVSGQPLLQRATQCLALLKQQVGDNVALIGVGGVDSLAAAQEKLAAGADLLQVYTGLIYQGPGLLRTLS